MKDANELSKRYNSLFSLPSGTLLILATYIFSLLRSVLDNINKGFALLEFMTATIYASILYFSIFVVLVSITIALVGEERKILDFRRTIGLYLLSSVMGFPFHIIFSFLKIRYEVISLGFEALSLGITAAYISLSIPAIIRTSYSKSIILSYLYVLLFLFVEYDIVKIIPNDKNIILTFFLTTTLFILSSHITLRAVNKLGHEKGVNALDAFRGFMSLWLIRDNKRLEEFFEKIGQERNIKMGLVAFRSKNHSKIKALWVLSNIHPGPFLNAGSAKITYQLAKTLEKNLNIQSVSILHGTCSHYHNLTRSNYIKDVYGWIKENIEKSVDKIDKFSYYRIYEKPLTFLIFQIDNAKIPIITCENCSMDDISYSLGLLAINNNPMSFIIDAHNSLDKKDSTTPADVKPWHPYGEIILNAIRNDKNSSYKELNSILLGVAKNRDCKEKFDGAMGSDGISVYIFKNGNKRELALVVLDSNNLTIGIRNRLRSKLIQDMGFSDIEIVTTDTHEINAASPKEGSYPMISNVHEEALYKCLKNLLEEAESNVEEVEILAYFGDLKNVKVWGEENYNFLKSLVYNGLIVFKYVFNTALLLSSILSLILIMLINTI